VRASFGAPAKTATTRKIMDEFARSTGLASDLAPRRYLWTDAFAVCNYLGLSRATGERRYHTLALALVDQVHSVLGRHRHDDPRTGWISGLSEAEGTRHPTAGGLRIGKKLPERGPHEPYDPQREWDRDGQYYHYLTRWMHALHRVYRETDDAAYHRWAIELARAAQTAFVYKADPRGELGMYWKVSIDLSRPLVPSMGAHDPLDGLVMLSTLEADPPDGGTLSREIAELAGMCRGERWATDDALGIGGLLVDAYRMARLLDTGGFPTLPGAMDGETLLRSLLGQIVASLDAYARTRAFDLPAEVRLPFRDLGLAIGLAAAEGLASGTEAPGAGGLAIEPWREALSGYLPLRDRLVEFWLDPTHRGSTWADHADINSVMLATSLAPAGYLDGEQRDLEALAETE